MNMVLAPIVLFVYNRPAHTERTLDALSNNDLASESELYIYADGPKPNATSEQQEKIAEVRNVIRKRQWCREVHIVESEINKGLANSIIEGVTKTVSKYGRVIVLEDDLETSPSFLTYMNKALDYYSPFQSVFSISSDIPMKMPVIKEYDFDVFVSHRNFSYGWGTWCDRWQQVDWSMGAFNMLEKDVFMQQAFNRGGSDLYNMLQAQKQHKIDSWSIRFTLAHFVLHAVSIMPTQSFIRHLGLDGSGTHCPSTQMISERKLNMKTDFHFLPVIYEDKRFIDAFYMCYVRKKLPLIKRLINKMLKVSGFK